MSDAQLKLNIINRIALSEDSDLLREIEELMSFQSNLKPLIVDHETKKSIEISRKQIEENNVIFNDDLQSELKEWLKE